ncbi:hypothetical protein QBC45DRAFT_442375, partial [Copromyces sp. CBS 386.78]
MDAYKNLDQLRNTMDPYAHIESWAETLEKKKKTQSKPANAVTAASHNHNEFPIDFIKDVQVTSCMIEDKKYTFTEVDGVITETTVRDRHGRITRTEHKNGKTHVEKPNLRVPRESTTITTTTNDNDDYDADGNLYRPRPCIFRLSRCITLASRSSPRGRSARPRGDAWIQSIGTWWMGCE